MHRSLLISVISLEKVDIYWLLVTMFWVKPWGLDNLIWAKYGKNAPYRHFAYVCSQNFSKRQVINMYIFFKERDSDVRKSPNLIYKWFFN